MLKSITRRKKKYIFLDYMIVVITSLYLRIRTVDMDFYASLQPNYLWLLTILFGLMFAIIGRVQCILICANLNVLSIYLLGTSTSIVLMSSIYKLTYDCLILLIICHSLNIFRSKSIDALTLCFQIGNYFEFVQVFMNLNYFKYFLFILIVSLSLICLRCRQLQQSNYFVAIKHLFTIRIALKQSLITLYILFTLLNLNNFIEKLTSSLFRYVALISSILLGYPFMNNLYYLNEGILQNNVTILLLFQFDNVAIFYIGAQFFLIIFLWQFFIFVFIFKEIDPKIPQSIKYINYDAIVLFHYCILKNSYTYYNSYEQYKNIIYILATSISILLYMRKKNFFKSLTNKKNYYYNNSYDQFESARNDDTVF